MRRGGSSLTLCTCVWALTQEGDQKNDPAAILLVFSVPEGLRGGFPEKSPCKDVLLLLQQKTSLLLQQKASLLLQQKTSLLLQQKRCNRRHRLCCNRRHLFCCNRRILFYCNRRHHFCCNRRHHFCCRRSATCAHNRSSSELWPAN